MEYEPDWKRTGHDQYPGYKIRQGRRPGHTGDSERDATGRENVDVQAAWKEYQRTKQRVEEGHLVNWQDAISSQKVKAPFPML